jgi:tRNA(Ile)-lysidine synthase
VRRSQFKENIERRFAEYVKGQPWFRAGLKIGVGVSGGADSVALLKLFAELRSKLGTVVSAVHFNHRLRGKESDADEQFVAALAEKFGVTFHVGRADVAGKAKREKANLEDAARRARYGFFERIVDQGMAEIVATAHTMDDQAETVLAHIVRGTGVAGLAGIHPVAGTVVRPLLGFRHDELRKYLRERKQSWREDATNRDTTRMRARMRSKLLPLLERQFNRAVVEHLAALAERAHEQASFVEDLAGHLFEKSVVMDGDSARMSVAAMFSPFGVEQSATCSVLRAKLIQEIVKRTRQRRGQLSAGHLEAIVTLAKSGEPGKRLQLPGGIDVVRERHALLFKPRPL